jgi:CO dehydrogenase/acetyl-CoA synthase alpha subunit
MSEKKMQESWYDPIREANKTKIKELAALMNNVVDNPRVSDEELEQIVGSLRAADPHALDTAADGCNG